MWANRLILLFIAALGIKAIRKQPPRDYPYLSNIPKTPFDCKKHPVGYYADPLTKCQVYHMCDMKGNKFSYLCPNGTLFHQQLLICAHWYQVNCTKSLKLYEVNKIMFPYEKYPEDRLHKHQKPNLVIETQPQIHLHTQSAEDSQTQQTVLQTHFTQEIATQIQPESRPLQPVVQQTPVSELIQQPQLQTILPTQTQIQLNQQAEIQQTQVPLPNDQPRILPPHFNSQSPVSQSQIHTQFIQTQTQIPQIHNQPLLNFPTTTAATFLQPSRRTFPPFSRFRLVSQLRTIAPSLSISDNNGQLQLSTQKPIQTIHKVATINQGTTVTTDTLTAESILKQNKINNVPEIGRAHV